MIKDSIKEGDEDQVYCMQGNSVEARVIIQHEIHEINKQNMEIPYELFIQKADGQQQLKSQTQHYMVKIKDQLNKRQWTVSRRYVQFKWLFQSLKVAMPGCVLPYFPSTSIQNVISAKITFMQAQQKNVYLVLRLQELNSFIQAVSKHPILGFSQELKIFVIESPAEFRRMKNIIDIQIEQLNKTESTSNSFISIFERGLAWISNSASNQVEESQSWTNIKNKVNLYSEELVNFLHKFNQFKQIKKEEVSWRGPQTSIDSVEILKTKVISGQQFNQILIKNIETKILFILYEQLKILAQLQQQLTEKDDIQKLIKYLYKFSGNQFRIDKLNRRKLKFQANFNQGFESIIKQWKIKIQKIDIKFRQIWSEYCRCMSKIWK